MNMSHRAIEIVKPEEEKALEAMKELYAKIAGKDLNKLFIEAIVWSIVLRSRFRVLMKSLISLMILLM